jgi:FKBP-type peptidyl-prolyl cis-trans isomerase 2
MIRSLKEMMIIDGSRVSLEYTLTLDDGRVVSTSVDGALFVYVHGHGQIPSVLEQQIAPLQVNDAVRIRLSVEEAYGPVNPAAFRSVSVEALPESARARGTVVDVTDAEGKVRQMRVHEVHADHIVLDSNHQLAGHALTFDFRVVSIE